MSDITTNNFGILIAYLVPGFMALAVLSAHSEVVHTWLGASPTSLPTIGGFLYITIASLGAGTKDVSPGNFGVLIAFVLPGFVVLWGVSYFYATVRRLEPFDDVSSLPKCFPR